ncbi:response regulator transcription factor [Anoxybacillus sp. ST70]|uniref:response regulator transcription factor n=1 Tax=Anoxybacillus sp. ST70 TaxID=2864180 RepID=UPI000368792D|nr:LuxR family transcriptional regulator [Anoxybacillus sp. ST70]
MNCIHLLKTTLSCFEHFISQPVILIIDGEIIFSYDSSEDIKYFFYKNESYLKKQTADISQPILLKYGLVHLMVFPIETKMKNCQALLFVSYPYHNDAHHYITCLIETVSLIIQKKYIEELFALEIQQLSEREKQIFFLILKGYSNKEIAQELVLSQHTIKNHVNNLFQKLDVKRRSQLIAKFNHFL